MNPTFAELDELVSRLPIDGGNYYIFDELLRQPYDLYRPVMDMLFEGVIVVEDLMRPSGSAPAAAIHGRAEATKRATYSSWDVTSEAIGRRCTELTTSVRPGGGVAIVARDQGAALARPDGSPGAAYVPTSAEVLGPDALSTYPTEIELARYGSVAAAQKSAQEGYLAAVKPNIE